MTEYLYRRNTVLEALRGSRRDIYRLWIDKRGGDYKAFFKEARIRGVNVEETHKNRLTQLAGDSSHQGVVLEVGEYPYSSIEDILELAKRREERPFLLLLDLLHGPQNIGTLLRAAEACGVHGVVLQDRRAPDITPSVSIYSSGAAEHLLIAQVTNLAQTIDTLKEADVWIAGLDLDEDAQPLGQVDLNMALAIVVGHEGQGLRRLIHDKCDFILYLPMRGRVESLNAATAGTVLLYAAWQARGFEGFSR